MRINGFEQIKGFYSWSFSNQELGIKPQHISLYLFLVNQNNRNNWVEWFKLPYDLAMAGSCISSKKTYYACLDDLQKWSLIKYQKGVNNWKAPLVKLEVLKDTSNVPQSEQAEEPLTLPQHIQQLIQAATPQPIHNIKLLTNNIKPITDNIKQVLCFLKLDDTEFIPVDEDLKAKKNELIILLCEKFGWNEMRFSNKQRDVSAFVSVKILTQDDYDNFGLQFQAYDEYKKLSEERRHNPQSLIGNQSEQFNDSVLLSENWIVRLENFKQIKPKSKLEKVADNHHSKNPYL